MKHIAWLGGIAALSLATPTVAQIAEAELPAPRFHVGGGVIVAQPVGAFGEVIDVGFGLGGHALYNLDPAGVISLRGDGGFIVYGSETKRVCLSQTVGCRIQVDLTTTNNIIFFNLGPQLTVPSGPVRPYANAALGLGYFSTQSSVEGAGDGEPFANTTNFDDATFAWAAGGGLYIPLRIGDLPLSIDLGARYNANGKVQYLREGDIEDNPDGSITFTPRESEAHLITYTIGVSIGLRPGG